LAGSPEEGGHTAGRVGCAAPGDRLSGSSDRRIGWLCSFWVISASTSPASWITSQLGCAARAFANPNNGNPSLFCDRSLDSEIAHAVDVQITDPAASTPLWATIDHEATLDAPLLSLFTQGGVDFVSRRLGNYQHNPVYQILLDQLWVT
jgi:hypothetical protein